LVSTSTELKQKGIKYSQVLLEEMEAAGAQKQVQGFSQMGAAQVNTKQNQN